MGSNPTPGMLSVYDGHTWPQVVVFTGVCPCWFEPHPLYFGDVLTRNSACGYWFDIHVGLNEMLSVTRMAERLRRWTQVPMDVNPRGFEPHSWYLLWIDLAFG